MNQSFEHLRRQVLSILRTVEPQDEETISHALMHLIISMPPDEIHKASIKEPNLRLTTPLHERTDGWRERITRNFSNAENKELKR